MGYKYAFQGNKETTAKAVATDVSVSTKSAIMVANFLRGKTVARAQRDLGEVLEKRMAVPFTRFTEGAGHKPGIGPGKYPKKASEHFLKVVNSCAANARDKGFGDELVITSITVHQAARPMRYGRLRGRQRKGTHIEVVVSEVTQPKKSAKKATPKSKAAEKPAAEAEKKEDKPAEKKAEPKDEKPAAKKTAKKAAAKQTSGEKE